MMYDIYAWAWQKPIFNYHSVLKTHGFYKNYYDVESGL